MKKILWLANLGADYAAYMNFRGMTELVGPDRIVCWPFKHTYNGEKDVYPERLAHNTYYFDNGPWCEMWTDEKLFRAWKPELHPEIPRANDGPPEAFRPVGMIEHSDEEVFQLLEQDAFSLIIMEAVRWHSSIATCEIRKFLNDRGKAQIPLVICDGEDYFHLRMDYMREFRPRVYFKRTYYETGIPRTPLEENDTGIPVRPLAFSSFHDISWVPWEERKYDMFCVFGATQVMRQKIKEVAVSVAECMERSYIAEIGHPLSHEEYLKTLSQSRIVIDHQSMGTDTLRFWEATGAGACVLSDQRIRIEPPLEPGVDYEQYEHDPSFQGNQFNTDDFERKLGELFVDMNRTKDIAKNAYQSVWSFHKCINRAQYILNTCRELGVSLEDFPK